jgi:hypothetical protein
MEEDHLQPANLPVKLEEPPVVLEEPPIKLEADPDASIVPQTETKEPREVAVHLSR